MRIRSLLVATLLAGAMLPGMGSASDAATFDSGVMIEAGFGTQTPPINFAAIPGIFGPSNMITLISGPDFGGTNRINLEGTGIFGACNSTLASICNSSAFTDPGGPAFTALIIYDYLGQLDPIVNVTAVNALAAYFDENTIVLDVSGLTFPAFSGGYQYLELAQVEFGVAAVPLPVALPLYASGLGLIGLFGWRRKGARRTSS